MLAADTALQVESRTASLHHSLADELTHAVAIQNLEGIILQNTLIEICRQELGNIVARESECHLRKVVGTEREELRNLGNLVGRNGRTGNLNHRTHQVVDTVVALRKYLLGNAVDNTLLVAQLLVVTHQRHHNLHLHGRSCSLDIHRSLKDCTRLHLGDLGIGVTQTATTMTEHRVHLAQVLHLRRDLLKRYAQLLGQLTLLLLRVGCKLVQGGIQQTDDHGITLHRLEQALEVATLHRQQLRQRHTTTSLIIGQNHLTHSLDTVALEEHMLRTAQSDTLGTESKCLLGIARGVGIGAHLHRGVLTGEFHQLTEIAAKVGILRSHLTQVNLTCRSVERDPIALLDLISVHLDGASLIIDVKLPCTRHAALTHTTRNHGRVRGHTAASRQDSGSIQHTLQILGRGLDTNQDRLLTRLGQHLLCILGEEYYGARSRTGRCGQALHQHLRVLHGALIKYGVQQLVQLGGLATQHGGLLVDQTLAQHIHCDLHHRRARTLSVTTLQHPQFSVLNRELNILHIGEILLQMMLNIIQFVIYRRHNLLERGVLLGALLLRDVLRLGPTTRALDGNLLRGTNTCHNILTLSIYEVLTIEDIFARSCIARECHTRSRVLAHITEHHRLHRYGRTPLLGDVVELAIQNRAFVHPRAEHRAHSAPELLPRAGGELLAGLLLHGSLERGNQLLEILNRKVGIQLYATLMLLLVDQNLEGILILLRYGLHTQHHVAIHLHETAIRIPRKTGIARTLRDSLHSLVIHTEVQDRIHHTGHRCTRARTYRHQQRLLLIAKLHTRQTLDVLHCALHLGAQHLDHGILALAIIFGAHLGGDSESRGYGNTDKVHLGEVSTLTTEQLSHLSIALGLFVTEGVNAFYTIHKLQIFIL